MHTLSGNPATSWTHAELEEHLDATGRELLRLLLQDHLDLRARQEEHQVRTGVGPAVTGPEGRVRPWREAGHSRWLATLCPAHGPGVDPQSLIGRRMVRLVASWHVYEGRRDVTPVELWLVGDHGSSTHVTSGTDWCLVVDQAEPSEGYDMGDWGRIDVQLDADETSYARHLGDTVLAAREEWEPLTGRTALELDFVSGTIRCESWAGALRITAVDGPGGPSTSVS